MPIAQLVCRLSCLASYSGENSKYYAELDGVTYSESGLNELGLTLRRSHGPVLCSVEGRGWCWWNEDTQNEIDVWGQLHAESALTGREFHC